MSRQGRIFAMIHIYTRSHEPATRYDVGRPIGRRMIQRHKKNELLPAYCCLKLRQARNLTVTVYYDAIYFWCVKGKGCLKPPSYHWHSCVYCRRALRRMAPWRIIRMAA